MNGKTSTLIRKAQEILSELQDREVLRVVVEHGGYEVLFERSEDLEHQFLRLMVVVEPTPEPQPKRKLGPVEAYNFMKQTVRKPV